MRISSVNCESADIGGSRGEGRGVFSQIWHSKHSGESWMVCVLGAGWGLGGMELRVGSNIMIFFLVLYTAASRTAHVLYIFCVIYICIVSSYICITFMNIMTFDYFVFT